MDRDLVKACWHCKCPKCRVGDLYARGLTLDLRERCDSCGLDISRSDSADGPAVFLIFILGFLLVPLALLVDAVFGWPLWVHAIVWGVCALFLTVGSLRPLKAYIIALQYKHRPSDWGE
ncbi:MAG: DUF983 domain-containing protein [Alphaproteobacteria bacterium]|nr:DUF983 domain-containing protein [Alphaproteobacteria bacterium]